jgi:hypothetical protein
MLPVRSRSIAPVIATHPSATAWTLADEHSAAARFGRGSANSATSRCPVRDRVVLLGIV